MHISVLKLKAILFGFRSLCDHICDSHIKIHFDNITAVHYINNMGNCRSVGCDKITKSIWDFGTGPLKGGYDYLVHISLVD